MKERSESLPTCCKVRQQLTVRDEGRAYAERLINAGVKTTYVKLSGTVRGFFSMTRFLSQGLKANDEAAAVMGAFFGT